MVERPCLFSTWHWYCPACCLVTASLQSRVASPVTSSELCHQDTLGGGWLSPSHKTGVVRSPSLTLRLAEDREISSGGSKQSTLNRSSLLEIIDGSALYLTFRVSVKCEE